MHAHGKGVDLASIFNHECGQIAPVKVFGFVKRKTGIDWPDIVCTPGRLGSFLPNRQTTSLPPVCLVFSFTYDVVSPQRIAGLASSGQLVQ